MAEVEPPDTKHASAVLTPVIASHVLQDMGYRGKLELVDGWAYVHSAAHGADFRVTLYSPGATEGDTPCRSCQFRMGFAISPRADLAVLNERCRQFNETMRFSKGYAYDYGGDTFAAVELDIITDHGDGPAHFEAAAGTFIHAMSRFLEDVMSDLPQPTQDSITKVNRSIALVRGDPEELAEGIRLLAEASEDGFAGAQNNYGDQFERGHGVTRSDVFAVHWYTRSAERGEPTAYLSLASLLSESSNDPVVLQEALKFGHLAFRSLPDGTNKDKARYLIGSISEVLPEPARDAAFQSARAWRPLHQERTLLSDTPDKLAPIADPPSHLN